MNGKKGLGVIVEVREIGKGFDSTLYKSKAGDVKDAMRKINKFAKEKGLL